MLVKMFLAQHSPCHTQLTLRVTREWDVCSSALSINVVRPNSPDQRAGCTDCTLRHIPESPLICKDSLASTLNEKVSLKVWKWFKLLGGGSLLIKSSKPYWGISRLPPFIVFFHTWITQMRIHVQLQLYEYSVFNKKQIPDADWRKGLYK